MAHEASGEELVRLNCACGGELQLDPEVLGRIVTCPHCKRFLRPALQFLLVDEELAPNITVPCPCGRFIVEDVGRAGKQAQCKACGRKLILPAAVDRPSAPSVVRVTPQALKAQLRRGPGASRSGGGAKTSRLKGTGKAPAVALRPGQQQCVNPACRAALPAGANVCALCATNVKTGIAYDGRGPEDDPKGKWSAPD
ncbi:MAG: hypothetical protein QGH74_05945 [Candidatus Brocadiia bacterium]|jgi:hypothetical protein|nr:hypothetical protein [Candidatus Brocadiia bacterium]